MGAVVVIVVGTAIGTLLAVVAQHYLRQALRRWITGRK